MNLMQAYTKMSPEDKEALKQLKKEESERQGKEVPMTEIMKMVTPEET